MRIAFFVQRPEQFAHAREERGKIGRLLVLGIGALGDMDVEPEAREALLRQRPAAGEPVGGIDRLDDDGRDLGILAQDPAVRSLTADAISAFSVGALRKLE